LHGVRVEHALLNFTSSRQVALLDATTHQRRGKIRLTEILDHIQQFRAV
jgi:hypothetical protein